MNDRDFESHLILLTCTVKPNSDTKVKRNDPRLRLDDYISSIIKWVELSKHFHFKIVVLENSNSIELIKRKIPKGVINQISFLQYPVEKEVVTRGISHGEFKLLQHFSEQNQFLENFQYIWKVTGRLFVSNFGSLVPKDSFDLVLNRFFYPRHLIDTRIVGFSLPTFKHLVKLSPHFYDRAIEERTEIIHDSLKYASLEDLLTFFAHRCEMVGGQVKTMRRIPIYEGTSASIDKQLDKGLLRIGLRISNLLRPIAIKMLRGSAP